MSGSPVDGLVALIVENIDSMKDGILTLLIHHDVYILQAICNLWIHLFEVFYQLWLDMQRQEQKSCDTIFTFLI